MQNFQTEFFEKSQTLDSNGKWNLLKTALKEMSEKSSSQQKSAT